MGTAMKFAKKSDIIIIAAAVLAGLVLWAYSGGLFGRPEGLRAEIYYKSELVRTIDLTAGKEESFSVDGLPDVVFHLYSDGSIAFIESDCPDKVCVRTGKIHAAGQMSACLPNQVYIKIVGNSSGETEGPDIIIG
jgi:hypothetical protein